MLLAVCLCGCSWIDKVRGHPTLQAQGLLQQAHEAEEAGKMAQAGLLLNRAIDANPEDDAANHELARLLLQQGEVDGAIAQLRQAVARSPDDVDNYVQLARVQLDHRRHAAAEQVIDAALEHDPDHVATLLLKAELAEIRGSEPLALAIYHRVLARDPESIAARQRIADMQIAAGRPDRAAPLLRQVCDSEEANEQQRADALWSLGVVYGQQSRWRDAAAALASSVPRRRSMSADDWYRLAYARYAAGDLNGAWADIERVLDREPDHRLALSMSQSLQTLAANHTPGFRSAYQQMAMALPTPAGW